MRGEQGGELVGDRHVTGGAASLEAPGASLHGKPALREPHIPPPERGGAILRDYLAEPEPSVRHERIERAPGRRDGLQATPRTSFFRSAIPPWSRVRARRGLRLCLILKPASVLRQWPCRRPPELLLTRRATSSWGTCHTREDLQALVQIAGALGIGISTEELAVREWMSRALQAAGVLLQRVDTDAAWDRVRVTLARKRYLTGAQVRRSGQ